MNCTGPCEQGRRDCPCPQACGNPEAPAWLTPLRFWIVYAVAIVCGLTLGVAWKLA